MRVTRIHGRFYDVSGFEHPGGSLALRCAEGRDATALFESYHLAARDRAGDALAKVPEITDPGVLRRLRADEAFSVAVEYDWSQKTAFAADLQSAAQRYLSSEVARRGCSVREAGKATPARWLVVILLGLAFAASLSALVRGRPWAAPAAGVTGWLYSVNFWHDALHFAMSSSPSVNMMLGYSFPWFSSVTMWMHQHVIGHHVNPNVPGSDPDMYHVPSWLLRLSPGDAWDRRNVDQQHRLPVIWSVAIPALHFLPDLTALHTKVYNGALHVWEMGFCDIFMHLGGRVFVFCSLFLWPWFTPSIPNTSLRIWFSFVPITLYSMLFMIFSQVSHLQTGVMPKSKAPMSSCFWSHQAATAVNYGCDSLWWFLWSGGLNLQIEHHLLPGFNHWHLRALQPEIERICRRHGVQYRNTHGGLLAVLRGHWRHVRGLGQQARLTSRR